MVFKKQLSRRFKMVKFLYCYIVFMLVIPSFAFATEYEGKVVSVADGDTITVLVEGNKQVKVRLAQIDAPEKSQAFGQKSKQSLSEMVFNKQVTVVQEDMDRYGRVVGRVYVGGLDVNAEQVKRGMAWVYRKYSSDATFIGYEDEAKSSRLGLWSDANPIPPWDFRHGKKQSNKADKKVDKVDTGESEITTSSPISSQCGPKTKCKEMTSCEEAKFYLEQCGIKRLDGNGDGVPCEKLCK
jgi:endonuclease YncB( thermonuclease family)